MSRRCLEDVDSLTFIDSVLGVWILMLSQRRKSRRFHGRIRVWLFDAVVSSSAVGFRKDDALGHNMWLSVSQSPLKVVL